MRIVSICVLSLMFAVLSFSAMAQSDNLVLYLPFEDGKGNIAADASGNGNDGVVTGADWIEDGKVGGALEFRDGGVVEIPFSGSLLLEEQYTLEAWVFATDIGDEAQRIITSGWADAGSYIIYIDNHWATMAIYANFVDSGGTRTDCTTGGNFVQEDVWYYIAATYDGENITLYVNGEQKAQTSAPGKKIGGKFPITIGGGSPGLFKGIIDEVRISNTAKSLDEIVETMNASEVVKAVEPADKAVIVWGLIKSDY